MRASISKGILVIALHLSVCPSICSGRAAVNLRLEGCRKFKSTRPTQVLCHIRSSSSHFLKSSVMKYAMITDKQTSNLLSLRHLTKIYVFVLHVAISSSINMNWVAQNVVRLQTPKREGCEKNVVNGQAHKTLQSSGKKVHQRTKKYPSILPLSSIRLINSNSCLSTKHTIYIWMYNQPANLDIYSGVSSKDYSKVQ